MVKVSELIAKLQKNQQWDILLGRFTFSVLPLRNINGAFEVDIKCQRQKIVQKFN
jgi:hypothetical protein